MRKKGKNILGGVLVVSLLLLMVYAVYRHYLNNSGVVVKVPEIHQVDSTITHENSILKSRVLILNRRADSLKSRAEELYRQLSLSLRYRNKPLPTKIDSAECIGLLLENLKLMEVHNYDSAAIVFYEATMLTQDSIIANDSILLNSYRDSYSKLSQENSKNLSKIKALKKQRLVLGITTLMSAIKDAIVAILQ